MGRQRPVPIDPEPKPKKAKPKSKAKAKPATPKAAANLFNPPGRPQPNPPLNITILHRFDVPLGTFPLVTRADLQALENKMSALSDKVAAIKTAVADMKARVQADIDDLKQKIADGAATPEILKDLDDIKTSLDDEDPIAAEPPPAP